MLNGTGNHDTSYHPPFFWNFITASSYFCVNCTKGCRVHCGKYMSVHECTEVIYICACVCAHVHTSIHVYICTHIFRCLYLHVYAYICIYLHIFICMSVYIYICRYLQTYIYIHTSMYIYIYMYIYVYICSYVGIYINMHICLNALLRQSADFSEKRDFLW